MSKRGIRRVSMRVRLAVAAAVLVGGGAAGVAVAAGSHSGPEAAQSAGFYQQGGRSQSYTSAMSTAMHQLNHSAGTSLQTMSHMKTMSTFTMMPWHHVTIALQRGTVVATAKNEIAVKSTNGKIELWHLNRGTFTLNVGGNATGTSAMTGGTMKMPAWWQMNKAAKTIATGDVVFVFGENENHTLKAQLVLFAAPVTTTATPTATATPSMTATTPAATVTPTATTTTPAATVTPSGTATTPAATVTTTPAVGGTCAPGTGMPTVINGMTVCVGARS